ncbi:MAG: hypothetical protein LBT53_06610 [Puniceicoccales bacterium]|nr:hypothetical protein [Puniceicoccales bacterium]
MGNSGCSGSGNSENGKTVAAVVPVVGAVSLGAAAVAVGYYILPGPGLSRY